MMRLTPLVDEWDTISVLESSKYELASCTRLSDVSSLLNLPTAGTNGRATLWHDENAGCDITGIDYSMVALDGDTSSGAALWNFSNVDFDTWSYGSLLSTSTQDTLLYYIK